jgi:fructose-1,6-bisphosphatase I
MLLDEHIENLPKHLRSTVLAISEASKKIRQGFLNREARAGTKNYHGEEQLELDKWAESVLKSKLRESGGIKAIVTEESQDKEKFDSTSELVLTIDPIDGSSLIDVNFTVGTIVGFQEGSFLKSGYDMLGAMYVLYGPLTILVYSFGDGVHKFVCNKQGLYELQLENLTMPEGKVYSPGALRKDWLPNHKKWIENLEKRGYKLRYSGSFGADVHQILHKGGVFSYPAFQSSKNGKLRLLYECIPMGYIIKQAGGAVSDGFQDILSIIPEFIHQRSPLYIGGKKEIELIESINRGELDE